MPPEPPPQDHAAPLRRFFFALTGGGAALCILLWWVAPATRPHLAKEDRFLEMLSAALFLFAFIIGLAGWLRPWKGPGKGLHALVPLAALLAFLDEVSFGRDILWSGQILLWGHEVDALHDLLSVIIKLWRDRGGVFLYGAGSLLIGAAVGLAFLKRRAYMPWVMTQIRAYPALDYLRFAIILIAAALVMDLDMLRGLFFKMLEEVLETSAGLALFLGAGLMHRQAQRETTPMNQAPAEESPPES